MKTMRTLLSLSLLLPTTASAAPENFAQLVGAFLGIINLIVPVLFGLSLLTLLWGITNAWIVHGADAEAIKKGKQLAVRGIIGLVIISGIWGIVAILNASLF